MTILPHLRDALVKADPAAPARPALLPQLRDGLVRAHPSRRRRRPALVALFAAGGLAVTGGALAASGVLPLPAGDPVEPKHVERDPERGVGVPTDQAGRLLALRVPDPAGGPPWGLRIVDTTRGMVCLQAGRVVGEQLGLLGQDGIGGDDGAFHPLPTATASAHVTPCQLPDGAGRFYIGVDKHSYASGDTTVRACREPGERSKEPRCPAAGARRIAFGLLGPEASKVTFRDGSTQVPTEGDGAYLFVTDKTRGETVTGMGGGPTVAMPWAGVKRVDYRDGTHCPASEQQAHCAPKGYVEPQVEGSGSSRRTLTVRTSRRRAFTWVQVRFRAPAAITDAKREYRLLGRFPGSADKDCRRTVMYVPSNRNVRRGDSVALEGTVPNACAGRLAGRVVLAATTERNDGGELVGRFTRPIAAAPSGPR
jgi:hypothetical protein